MKITANDIKVPLDVPQDKRDTYIQNYLAMTKESGRLMLFAGDQKVEHLNKDFYGEGVSTDDNDPEHLFRIASKAKIGIFATQLGLLARYGMDYRDVDYMIKLNSKSPLVEVGQADPISTRWFGLEPVAAFIKTSGLKIRAVGYTIYLGSENENAMLTEAAQCAYRAHEQGLLAVFWIYPRGKAVKDEKAPDLIAGAAGIGACLGADFVKVNAPKQEGVANQAELLQQAVKAAGRTKVVCAGGSSAEAPKFLQQLHDQVHIGGTAGNATGRNVHQRSLDEAVRFCNAIYAITVEDKSVEEAVKIYNG